MATDLAPLCRLETLKKRDILFLEGEHGEWMYFVLDGVVKLSKLGSKGNEVTVFLAQPGDVFAEILAHLNYRYPVTTTALEPTTLLAIHVKGLEDRLASQPQLASRFIGALAQRIKVLMKTIERLTIEDVKERFWAFLTAQASEDGYYILPVSKKEMALLLGVTPETFSRVLKTLEDDGHLRQDGTTLHLLTTEADISAP